MAHKHKYSKSVCTLHFLKMDTETDLNDLSQSHSTDALLYSKVQSHVDYHMVNLHVRTATLQRKQNTSHIPGSVESDNKHKRQPNRIFLQPESLQPYFDVLSKFSALKTQYS